MDKKKFMTELEVLWFTQASHQKEEKKEKESAHGTKMNSIIFRKNMKEKFHNLAKKKVEW